MPSRVLVVDDERSIRLFMEAMLVKEGYDVEAVASGKEALACLATRTFNVLLVDLKMEGMDGLAVMEGARKLDPDIAVIMLTGHGSLESAIHALRLGASDYLQKPCTDMELKASLRRATAQTQHNARARRLVGLVTAWAETDPTAEPGLPLAANGSRAGLPSRQPASDSSRRGILQVGDFAFDGRRRCATLCGVPLLLTPTEYNVLSFLAENAGCPVSSREIVLRAHGYECPESEAGQLVKLHIKNLRQKIERDPANPRYIQNVRAVGYLLQPASI